MPGVAWVVWAGRRFRWHRCHPGWARQVQISGAGEMLLTEKDLDGTKDGYDIPVTKAIADKSVGYSCAGHPGGVGTVDRICGRLWAGRMRVFAGEV